MRSTLNIIPQTNSISNIPDIKNKYIDKPMDFEIYKQFPQIKILNEANKNRNQDRNRHQQIKNYQNNDIYLGPLKDNQPHGEGLYKFVERSSDKKLFNYYAGNFENGLFHGYGIFWKMISDTKGLIIYNGEWRNGKRNGKGKEYYFQDRNLYYDGYWQNDVRSGSGKFNFVNGNYDGNWQNGKMNGNGKLTLIKGPLVTKISGENWSDDDIRFGEIQYFFKQNQRQPPIAKYKGKIKNLMRDGQGTYTQGQVALEGIFKQDDIIQKGVLRSKVKKQYEYQIKGDFTQPQLKKLNADIQYKNGDRYYGQVNISQDGVVSRTKGKYIFADGEAKQGEFQDNQKGNLIMKQKKL